MDRIVERAAQKGVEFFDMRIIEKESQVVEIKDGRVHKVLVGRDCGAGLRAIFNGAWGFASTTNLTGDFLLKAVDEAIAAAKCASKRISQKVSLSRIPTEERDTAWKPKRDPLSVPLEEKVELLKDMHKAASEVDCVHSVTTGCGNVTEKVKVISSEGARLVSQVTRVFAKTQVIAREGANVASFYDAIGGTGGWELLSERDPLGLSEEGGKSAARILSSKKSPSGRLPLIADQDLIGVFAHEAVGHASEADYIVRGGSCLEGMIGKRIGSELVSIIDDPTFEKGFGSFPFDAEGVVGQKKVLIERGILKEYIQSRETANLLGMKPNGGARVENYDFVPLVRMSNTFVKSGDSSFEELLEGISLGVYARGSRGGQVSPAKGSFQFNASEAFLIEKGEITEPLKDVSFGGSTLEVLKKIDAVGKDFQLGRPGSCGKEQWIPVSSGGPHVRVKEVMIGGS